jgi:oleate hydratase
VQRDTSIADQFDLSFFETDFWFMWCTTFAFQPWHSAVEFRRYLVRFTHMVAGFDKLNGIMRTIYNQYDSMVRPLRKWLEDRGVRFSFDSRVTDLAFCHKYEGRTMHRAKEDLSRSRTPTGLRRSFFHTSRTS